MSNIISQYNEIPYQSNLQNKKELEEIKPGLTENYLFNLQINDLINLLINDLIEKGLLNSDGNFSLKNVIAPSLEDSQIQRFNSLLLKNIQIKAKDNTFSFTVTIKEILGFLKIKEIEI